MFRRIELIYRSDPPLVMEFSDGKKEVWSAWKHGLLGMAPGEVGDAWAYKLRGPSRKIPRNAKFYFTERGWREVGRHVVAACQRTEQEYRVIRIKECEVNVVWRDRHYDFEVAAQPRKKRESPTDRSL